MFTTRLHGLCVGYRAVLHTGRVGLVTHVIPGFLEVENYRCHRISCA